MAGIKKYPGVIQVTETTFKLTLTDGYSEVADQQGNVILDEAGKPKKQQNRYFKTVTAKSAKEASDLRSQWITEIKTGGVPVGKKMTLKQLYDYWLEHHAKLHLAVTTQSKYANVWTRINSALGHKQIADITPAHINSFIKNLQEPLPNKKGDMIILSSSTVKLYHELISVLFSRALKWNMVSYNPAARVETPKIKKVPKKIYDQDTLAKFLNVLKGEPFKYQCMTMLAFTGSLRKEEIFGLQWSHVDFENNTVQIDQASVYITGTGLVTKETKTNSSNRLVSLPSSVMQLLKTHKAEQTTDRLKLGSRWKDNDRVFTAWDGAPAHPQSFNTWLRRLTENNDLPHIAPHTFRHMNASYLLIAGVDLRTVASKLGHSKPSVTADIYSHLLQSAESKTADVMESILTEAKNKKQAK